MKQHTYIKKLYNKTQFGSQCVD